MHASSHAPLAAKHGPLSAEGLRAGVVAARFNDLVTARLVEGAQTMFTRLGGATEGLHLVWVPGAFELPLALQTLAESRRFDLLVTLAAVIRGETAHFEHISRASFQGIQRVMLEHRVPIGCGILTCETTEQALARAGGKVGNKGAEAMQTAVEMTRLLKPWRNGGS